LQPQDRTASGGIDRHFLAYLSHELRTPLNAILGWTQILQSGVIRRDTALRALRQIEQRVQAQAHLLDELLNASEIARAVAFDPARPDLGTGLSQAGATEPTPDEGAAYRRLAGLRIVAVDDDSNTRDMLQETLARAGARVHAAASARDALDLLQRYRPDVLVSDIGMPHEDGYALLQQLRALPPEEGGITPAIALTGHAREIDQIAARRAGYQAVVVKPVSLDHLMRTILDVTARR
jgi:CheY-like chemotaxis protein